MIRGKRRLLSIAALVLGASAAVAVLTPVVFVLFGFYLLYMYEPITTHYLFSRIFSPLI